MMINIHALFFDLMIDMASSWVTVPCRSLPGALGDLLVVPMLLDMIWARIAAFAELLLELNVLRDLVYELVGEWLKPKKARNIDHGSLAVARSEEPRSPDMKKLAGEGTWKTPTSTLGSALDSPKVPSALLLGPAPGLV